MSPFFKPPFSHLLHKVMCFIFGLFSFQINYFCILFSLLIISVGTFMTSESFKILDIAKNTNFTFRSQISHCP